MKVCSSCQMEKPFDEFYRQARYWSSWCRECHRRYARQQITSGYNRQRHERKARAAGVKPRRIDPISKHVTGLYANARKRAARNGKPFELTREWIDRAVREFCANNYYEFGRSPFQPSLDRIDATKWYVVGNVRVVWLIENLARNGFSDEEVVEFCWRRLGLVNSRERLVWKIKHETGPGFDGPASSRLDQS